MPNTFLRYGIPTTRAPGMASCNAFGAKPYPFEYTPFLNGLDRIIRTRWSVTTVGTKQGRKRGLVDFDGEDEESLYNGIGLWVLGIGCFLLHG